MAESKRVRRIGLWIGLIVLAILLWATTTVAKADSGPPPGSFSQALSKILSLRAFYEESRAAYQQILQESEARRWNLLRPQVITYTVQPGDNDWVIVQRFGLDVDTLRFSNAWMRDNPDLIYPGQEVIILPVKGAYHTVKAGETIESIARQYGVAPETIREFPLNGLKDSDQLRPGQKLIIPGGRLDYADRILPPGPGTGYALAWPLRGTISQGYHSGHRALDIATYYGAKVYASAAGRVAYARFSPGGWLGFTITIVHSNGLKTRYSHLSGIFVEEGQAVSRGQVIGQVGSTGNSTGPHVHFEVYQNGSKVNPLSLLPPSADQ